MNYSPPFYPLVISSNRNIIVFIANSTSNCQTKKIKSKFEILKLNNKLSYVRTQIFLLYLATNHKKNVKV